MANIVISIIAIIKIIWLQKIAHHPLEMIRQELGFDLNQQFKSNFPVYADKSTARTTNWYHGVLDWVISHPTASKFPANIDTIKIGRNINLAHSMNRHLNDAAPF
jgi:hypothetical protein